MSTSLPSNPSENRGPVLDAVVISHTIIAVVVMTVRLWVRGQMIRNIGYDDWIMLGATVVSILGMGMVVTEVRYGGGQHIGDIPPESLSKGLMYNFICQVVYVWGISITKLSVGTSLLRIASTKFWKRTILGFMIFVLVYTIVGFASILAQCSDIRAIWDKEIAATATCWPGRVIQIFGFVNFSLNIFSDLVFAIGIPLPMLWNINVSLRAKLSLFFILGLGCFATACACVRITYLSTYGKTGDWLWDTVDLAMWSIVELNISIVAGSLPSLRPLFKKFLGSIYGAGSRRGTTKAGGSRRTNHHWQPSSHFSSSVDKIKAKHHNGKFVPYLPTSRSFGDGGSQVQLSDHMQLEGQMSPPRSQDSFELCSYKVEARITTDSPSPKGLERKGTIGGGITKTTTMTVSYDDPRSA